MESASHVLDVYYRQRKLALPRHTYSDNRALTPTALYAASSHYFTSTLAHNWKSTLVTVLASEQHSCIVCHVGLSSENWGDWARRVCYYVCRNCYREKCREWRERDRKHKTEVRNNWYVKNRERVRQYMANYVIVNRSQISVQRHNYHLARYWSNLDICRKQARINKMKQHLRDRAEVLKRLGGQCARCGIKDSRVLQVDHINGNGYRECRRIGASQLYRHALAQGGNAYVEYQLLCANCNWKKRIARHEINEGHIIRNTKDRIYQRNWVRQRRKLLRARVLELLGRKCVACGNADGDVLQIDHIHGGGSAKTKEEARHSGFAPYLGILRQPITLIRANYQLLCANCNWIKRHERAEFPPHKYGEEYPLLLVPNVQGKLSKAN